MIDFDRWFARQKPVQEPEPELPDGVWEIGDGKYLVKCRGCDRWVDAEPEWVHDPKWDPLDHWGGCGPSCCP